MGEFKRKSDGRRIFTSDFKRSTVERIRSGTTTLAEMSRELEIAPAVLRNWMRLVERGGKTAVEAGEEVVALSRVRELEKQVRELQRLVGKQAMTIEILEAAREKVKKVHTCSKDRSGDRASHRSGLSRAPCGSSDGVVRERASYGIRRVHALVNRARRKNGAAPYNRKRIRRVMRINKLTLPGKIRRRDRPHTGTIRRPESNQRWCGDGLNIRCWNGDLVRAAFTLDCHDREVLGHVAVPRPLNGSDVRLLLDRSVWGRFGEATLRSPVEIEWLTDNDGIFTSLETRVYAEDLGFRPITTPAYSPESNGMAEAFVNTLKRDYVGGADLTDAGTVIRQLPAWLDDYNRVAPHSALKQKSPREWREEKTQTLCV